MNESSYFLNEAMKTPADTVFFDGQCSLCAFAVRFILRHERVPELSFCSLQSRQGRKVMEQLHMGSSTPESLVLQQGERLYTGSEAALRIAGTLRIPYRWLRVFLFLPVPFRDALYFWVARNRYRWFGKTDYCAVPEPGQKGRFVTD
jgi:predicted DCC family thiol-disulfide oxidoreductase YuxK